MPPDYVIPQGLSTLCKCSLTTLAQDKPYQEIPLIRDCCNHTGSCAIFNHRSRDQLLEFRTSFYETISNEFFYPREFQAHSIFTRALVLRGVGTNLEVVQDRGLGVWPPVGIQGTEPLVGVRAFKKFKP